MIDCHSHLACEAFDADRSAVIARALAAGVERVLVVGEDLDDSRRTLDVCARHAGVLIPCVGLHPDRFADDLPAVPSESCIAAIEQLARAHRDEIACIGEVGLDYWCAKDAARRSEQGACLDRMAALAAELALPLNVHSRSAGHYAIERLATCGARRVLMHAFDGKASHAARAAEQLGYVFSIPPSVVRSPQKQKLVARLPLEALLLESDSPVLGPEAGQRNEPANLVHAVRCIAAIRGLGEDRVREVTAENARRLFPDKTRAGPTGRSFRAEFRRPCHSEGSTLSAEVHFLVEGRVHGVMFRQTLIRAAQRRALEAGASNLGDGSVTCVLRGDPTAITAVLKGLEHGGPINSWGAQVSRLERLDPAAGLPLSSHQVTTGNVDLFRWSPQVDMYL